VSGGDERVDGCRLELNSIGLKDRRLACGSSIFRPSTLRNWSAFHLRVMSGLVGYESSDDEEPTHQLTPKVLPSSESYDALNHAPPRTDGGEPSEEQVASTPPVSFDQGVIGPLLGPAFQGDGTFATEEELVSTIALADMSERESIRHLTQATFPVPSLPPSPPGSPNPIANERFRRFLELKAKGIHFNEDLARKTNFRNPSLPSTLISKVGLDEKTQYNTSLPRGLWDLTDFPDWAYKEGLLKSQQDLQGQNDANKKTLSATGKRTIEFASETASGSSSRKSTPGQHSKRKRP
jgi:hypothetical protein